MRHHPKETRERAITLYKLGNSVRDVAEIIDAPDGTVAKWITKADCMRPPMQRPVTPEEIREAVRLHRDEGWNQSKIGRYLGRSNSTVRDWLIRERDKGKPGVRSQRVVETREDYDAREARQALAHFIPRPLREGGWYANGWWGR